MRARIIRDDSLPFNKKRRLSSLVPAAARRVLLERLEARQLLSAALDTSFGGNGMVDTPRYDMFNVQPDNKILLALMDLPASESSNVTLYRYNNDGTPDTSYGSGGTLSIHPAFVPQARWLSGGKLYVAAAHAATTADSAVFDLARYNADGSLDSTFGGGDGIASASFTGINPAVHGIVTASDGDLVVGGQAGTDAAVARFNSDGSLDTTFGGDGTVQRFIHANGGSSTLTVAPNGDAYISVGYYDEVHGTWPSTVYRFHRDGSSDNFAPGFVPETFQAGGTKKIIPDGNNLIRYNADDSQDATFNPNGLGFGTFGDNRLLRVLALPDDSILVSGTVPVEGGTPGQFQGFLAKLQPNGDLDTSFAPGGIVKFLKGYQTWGNDMQTTPDGKVVMHAGFQQFHHSSRRFRPRRRRDCLSRL